MARVTDRVGTGPNLSLGWGRPGSDQHPVTCTSQLRPLEGAALTPLPLFSSFFLLRLKGILLVMLDSVPHSRLTLSLQRFLCKRGEAPIPTIRVQEPLLLVVGAGGGAQLT